MFWVKANGRVVDRGFETYQQAFNWANEYVKGLESHKVGSKIYTPDFSIEEDKTLVRNQNKIWQDCKTHTQVRI